jgi:superfamily II DNA or RNA helicase
MARIDPTSADLVSVKSKTAELVRRLGSVNKASVALTEALGESRSIYPNRLHVLLGDDSTKTVNGRTFGLIRDALAQLERTAIFAEPESPEAIQFTLSLADRWKSAVRNRDGLRQLADEVNQPVAVVRHTLEVAGVLAELPVHQTVLPGESENRPARAEPKAPDYSFQDAAVDQCLAVFRRDSRRRAGLVVPTGGGKTDMALRVGLGMLKREPDANARVIWVTHRRALKDQSRDRLQVMIGRQVKGLSPEDIRLFGEQIEFVMLKDLPLAIARCGLGLRLIVIDEAHHAAAVSYDPAFEIDPKVPVLALTATPNRTDNLPIRIDEIAFSITFRELTERGVILRPEIEKFPVDKFDWSDDAIDRLAGHLLAGGGERYHKVIIIAPQVDKVVRIHELIKKRLSEEDASFFAPEDVHFISSHGNSAGTNNEAFLTDFRQKHTAIIVSAQLLLEGYDDPLVDTIVITYRTESVIMLMQAAGRCVRYSPGKKGAYVIQAADERIAYFFDNRWLYQDLSDFPRPQLLDVSFSDPIEREREVRLLLGGQAVPAGRTEQVVAEVNALPLVDEFQLLFAGEPYYGKPTDFDQTGRWHVCVLTPATRGAYVEVYNGLCAFGRQGAEIDVENLVRTAASRYGIAESRSPSSAWILLFSLALSLQKALMEVHDFDREHYHPGGRVRPASKATSWLKYVCFRHHPKLPQEVLDFTAEAINSDVVREDFIRNPGRYAALVRQPLPLGAYEVFSLTPSDLEGLTRSRTELVSRLGAVPGASRPSEYRAWLVSQPSLLFPVRFYEYFAFLTRHDDWQSNVLILKSYET